MQAEMECPRPGYGVFIWLGSQGCGGDIERSQAVALLRERELVPNIEPDANHNIEMMNMKEWQGGVFQICGPDTKPIEEPLIYALIFNEVPGVNAWMCTAEYNESGIFHVHCMLQTSMRSDSCRRSFLTRWERLLQSETFNRMFTAQCTLGVLKLQRVHKPSSLGGYMMKNPEWILSNHHQYLQNLWDMERFGYADKWKPVEDQPTTDDPTPEMNPMCEEIIGAIMQGGARDMSALMRVAPGVMAKYLHRPGLQQIVTNCLQYVQATGGAWSLDLFKHYDPDPEPIHKILLFQGIMPTGFDATFHCWLTKGDTKKNTIVLWGPSNTGKSAFIRGFKDCVSWGECVNTTTFAFEGLPDHTIGVWEEPLIGPELVEKAKQVFEGMTCSVPVKFKRPAVLPRTPIIMTTNHAPWRFCGPEEGALRNRMYIFMWEHQIQGERLIYRCSDSCCQCRYCTASCGGAITHGVASARGVQRTNQPVLTQQQSSGTESGTNVGARPMSTRIGGDGQSSGSGEVSYQSPESGEQSTDDREPRSSTSTAAERDLDGNRGKRSGDSNNGIHKSGSQPKQSLVTGYFRRDHGGNTTRDGSIRGRQQQRGKSDGSRTGKTAVRRPAMLGTEKSTTTQKEVPVPTKQRRVGGEMGPLAPEMYIPTKSDWQQYLSWLYHQYG
uniref:Nonstructural protein 1 n=1 Tax=Grus japonensis Chaphamaparvovirus TaxID=2794490 RepID=A0A8A4XD88_9VIRU|nr:MAG: nonstructural protein 1 [Grus japonensis Chaphamaparvovirus]